LDGYGEVYILGNSTSTSEKNNYWGVDIFTDLTLTPSENGYYTMTKYGQIYSQGDAVPLAIAGVTERSTDDLGFVGLEYTPNAEGFLVLGASGEVTPLLNARLGPDFALNPEEEQLYGY
jgi:hypothetical protein